MTDTHSIKRLIVTAPRAAEFQEVPIPVCPPEGLLVRAQLTAISTGTEIRVYRGIPVDDAGRFLHEWVPFELPTENGYSMVGEVLEVGVNVADFAVGDRVFVPAPHRQLAAMPAGSALKLPAALPDEKAVFLNILEVGHLALRRGHPAPGSNVAIVGLGVIGLSGLAYAVAFGCRTVAVDPDARRRSIAERMGADLAVSPTDADFADAAKDRLGSDGADVVLEAASSWSAIRTAMQIARPGGTIVVVARHTDTPDFNPVGHPFLGKTLSLVTSYGYPPDGDRWDRCHSIALTLDLLARGSLPVELMITHRFAWHELPDVYSQLDRGGSGIVGAVVRW